MLTPAECRRPQLPTLLAALPQPPGAGVCEKVYNPNKVGETSIKMVTEPVIPSRATRLDQREQDQQLSADRNKVERLFGRLQEARGFATRYQKTASAFVAVAHLLAALD